MSAESNQRTINFLRGVPAREALERLIPDVSKGYERAIRRYGVNVLQYGHFVGFKPLRDILGQMHGVDPDRIIAGNGGMEVISLFFKSLPRQSTILIEETTYDRVVTDALRYGHRLIGVPLGREGIDLDVFARQVNSSSAAAFYGIPFHHNPTGLNYSVENRKAVEAICRENGLLCAWDVCYETLRYDGIKNEPVAVSDWGPILFSSFTKTISPGTKCGYMVIPAYQVALLTDVLSNTRLNPNLPTQAFIADFIESGKYTDYLDSVCQMYKSRMDALNNAMAANFPAQAAPKLSGGFFATLCFEKVGTDREAEFIAAAQQAGVNISAAWGAVAPDMRDTKKKEGMFIRLTFPACEADLISWGFQKLKEVESNF